MKTQQEFYQIQRNAQELFIHRHYDKHDNKPDTKQSCGICCLNGYHPKEERKDFINYAGWARLYIQAGKFIPKNVRFDFLAELASNNRAYANALVQDIRDFGINCEAGPFRNAVMTVLGIYPE